jgi:hypothetical protein
MANLKWNPGKLIELSGYFWKTCTLHAAVKLDVFTCLGNIILHHHHLVESWSRLDQGVQSGGPVRERSTFSDEECRESFLMGMFNMAMNMAPMLVPKINISSRRHLLDLGGGPGTCAIHFCRHNPQLNATVFDLPTSRPFAEKTIKRFDLSDRIDFRGGNYLKDDIEGRFDAAWLSHILHGEGPEECLQRSYFNRNLKCFF